MKILVDVMPQLPNECTFSIPTYMGHYLCELTQKDCDLNIFVYGQCRCVKELKKEEVNNVE